MSALLCSWCGSPTGVQMAEVHPNRPARLCGERSPFDPRQSCGLERGHLSACRVTPEPTPTPLCFRCFGTFRESGERPPDVRIRNPQPGPITGRPFIQVARTMPRIQRR